MTVGEFLAVCREIKGCALREVEQATGLSNAFVSQIETKNSGLSLRNAVKLCDCYGISIERLAVFAREEK